MELEDRSQPHARGRRGDLVDGNDHLRTATLVVDCGFQGIAAPPESGKSLNVSQFQSKKFVVLKTLNLETLKTALTPTPRDPAPSSSLAPQ